MQPISIAFIGAGNMASALIGGLIQSGFAADTIWASNPEAHIRADLSARFNIHVTDDNKIAAENASVIIFCVKPQIMKTVLVELAPVIAKNKPLIISIVTGIRTHVMEELTNQNAAIVRCMPNTPALLQSGASGLYANANVTTEQKTLAESIMRAVGMVVWTKDEAQIDVVTAISGSGPAYFFLLMELLEQAGEQLGLSKEVAHLLTIQTAFGAAKMALESNQSLVALRQQVTSPGGTTQAAISVFEKADFKKIVTDVVNAAKTRAEELSV
jgi:pyrroline-5-carboxylate reductase